MSMISELVKDLRDLEKTSEFLFGTRTEVPRVARQAADTIEDLSTKLTAANMERSSAWYGGGWIPVEERLPEECTEVLVWYEYRWDSSGKMIQTYGIGWCSMDGWHGDVYGLDARCIAWTPLPTPYKGGDTDAPD